MKVRIKNSTGQSYKGHTSIWITNRLQELRVYLEEVLINVIPITGWVNGNLYVATNETLGILPIPGDVRDSSGMAPFVDIADSTEKLPKHKFLAEMQGTQIPCRNARYTKSHPPSPHIIRERAFLNPDGE